MTHDAWVPASLTVEKQLWPSDDPARFDLVVHGVTVRAADGDGDTITISVPPGTYDVSESAVAGTDTADFVSTVSCRPVTRRRSVLRSGTAWNGLVLRAGGQATCTFGNVNRTSRDPVPPVPPLPGPSPSPARRSRLSIRVAFEPGSATAPATLTRTIVVCGRATRAPRVTG